MLIVRFYLLKIWVITFPMSSNILGNFRQLVRWKRVNERFIFLFVFFFIPFFCRNYPKLSSITLLLFSFKLRKRVSTLYWRKERKKSCLIFYYCQIRIRIVQLTTLSSASTFILLISTPSKKETSLKSKKMVEL